MYVDNNNLVIIEPKSFHFHFDLHKDADKYLKHEIDSVINGNGFLAEQRIKNKIDQLLFKYKHGNDIHEPRKQ